MIERAEHDHDVAFDVYASELRGHRAGLGALPARLTDPSVPDIKIKYAKIVCCYPFSIPGLDGAEICRRATQLAPASLGRSRAFIVAETELSDIWGAQGKQGHGFPTCRVSLLDYLAVSPEFRGGGIASALLQHGFERW